MRVQELRISPCGVSMTSTSIAPQSREYRERKSVLQDTWRDRIFERDQFRCNICGEEGPRETLHLAHVTTAYAFVRCTGDLAGMDLSYRDDNLLTLCSGCHKIQHRQVDRTWNPKLKELLGEQDSLRTEPLIKEWLDLAQRIRDEIEKAKVEGARRRRFADKLFRSIKKERGWVSAQSLVDRERGSPTWEILGYTPSDACREPSVGSKKRNRVASGSCTYTASTCAGEISPCHDCGLPYCEYHFPTHRRDR